LADLKLPGIGTQCGDGLFKPIKEEMPEHVCGNDVLWSDWQDVQCHPFWVRCREGIKAGCEGIEIAFCIGRELCVVISLDGVSEI
jgi:hypothetical protein